MFFNALDPSNGLGDLGEALPISLTINTPYQIVGGKPVYTLIGAPPGVTVYWSSWKDGTETGELTSSYGQTVEANGTAKLEGGAWTDAQVGTWTKIATVQTPDGQNHTAMVQFRVSPTAPATGTVPAATGTDFFSTPLFYLGSYGITPIIAGVGGFLIYKLFLSGKR